MRAVWHSGCRRQVCSQKHSHNIKWDLFKHWHDPSDCYCVGCWTFLRKITGDKPLVHCIPVVFVLGRWLTIHLFLDDSNNDRSIWVQSSQIFRYYSLVLESIKQYYSNICKAYITEQWLNDLLITIIYSYFKIILFKRWKAVNLAWGEKHHRGFLQNGSCWSHLGPLFLTFKILNIHIHTPTHTQTHTQTHAYTENRISQAWHNNFTWLFSTNKV